MKYDELLKRSLDELKEEFNSNMESNKYRHDMAVLIGSLGISPKKYTSFMKTLDDIEAISNK